MSVGVKWNQKLNSYVYSCPDCGGTAFLIITDGGTYSQQMEREWTDCEVACPQCKEGFWTDFEVVLNTEIDEDLDERNS